MTKANYTLWTLASPLILLLGAGCSGVTSGNTTTNILDDYKTFKALDDSDFTPNSDLAPATGTVSYEGVAELTNGSGLTNSFLGEMTLDIDFKDDTYTGTVEGFKRLVTSGTTRSLGASVSGSLDLDGQVFADNETKFEGLVGTADGDINGVGLSMTTRGNFLGSDGANLYILFSGGGAGGQGWAAKDD